MKGETIPIRTMRDIMTGIDVAREKPGKIKTLNKVMYGGEPIKPKVNERHVAVLLEQERRRFARQSQAWERGRKKVHAYRERLAGTVEKNTRLMALRYALQKKYWTREEEPVNISQKQKGSRKRVNEIKLGY